MSFSSSYPAAIINTKSSIRTALFFCADMSAASLSAFNPTIVSQLGWTARRAQVMTIPVWVCGITGALVCTLTAGKLNLRWPFILTGISISTIGWTLHLCQVAPVGVRYFAQFIIAVCVLLQYPTEHITDIL